MRLSVISSDIIERLANLLFGFSNAKNRGDAALLHSLQGVINIRISLTENLSALRVTYECIVASDGL